MNVPRHIVLSGAGLVGSLLAVMLGRRGYEVSVYEKRADLRTAEISAGRSINLALAERGIDALKRASLFDDVEKLLIPMRGRMLHSLDCELEFSPYGWRPHEVIHSVSRGELNCLMMTEAEKHPLVNIYFEQKCQSVDFQKRLVEVVDERTHETRQVDFEVLIGCDGVGSPVRAAIVQATTAQPTDGHVTDDQATSGQATNGQATNGQAANGQCKIDMLDHNYKELIIPAGPNESYQIEKEALHIWPRGGFMLIALPNLGGSYTVTLFLAKQGPTSFEQLSDRQTVLGFFEEHFPDAVALMPDLAEQFFENPAGELGTVRCWPWSANGAAMILGDAAHAVVPFHGQGMNAGFEDCTRLMQLLDEFEDDWPTVMESFQAQRKPNTDAIAGMALENYVVMRESVADEKFQLKKELGFELERRFPDRFIPRYSMVMFHTIPYDVALQRGELQTRILDELVEGKSTLAEIEWDFAEQRIEAMLEPLEHIGD